MTDEFHRPRAVAALDRPPVPYSRRHAREDTINAGSPLIPPPTTVPCSRRTGVRIGLPAWPLVPRAGAVGERLFRNRGPLMVKRRRLCAANYVATGRTSALSRLAHGAHRQAPPHLPDAALPSSACSALLSRLLQV